ncbi:MAG: putative quinol monooxygenase [Sphingomonas sp.]
MIVIVGSFRVDPARVAEARPVMAAMIAASRAEPGCLDYSYSEDVLDPGLVRVIERWTDRGALFHHFASAHIADWRATWGWLGISGRELMLYESGSGESV